METEYQRLYREKTIAPEKALDFVPDGGVIVTGGAAQEPATFFSRLHTIAPRITRPVQIYNTGSERVPPWS